MKYLWVFAFLLASCSAVPAQAASSGKPFATVTLAAPYHTPTPSVDYVQTAAMAQGTAQMAELTAQAAERLNVAVTADAERRAHELMQMTAQAEERGAEVYSLTALAAPTSIPLTSTAQAVNWTAIADYQQNMAGQLTATKEAPTQIYLADRAIDEARMAPIDLIARWFGLLGIGAAGFAITAFVFVFGGRQVQVVEPSAAPEPVLPIIVPVPDPAPVVLQVQHRAEYPSGEFVKLPCTPAEFGALVDVILGGGSWAYNQWQGTGSPIPFRVFTLVRRACLVNKWIQPVPPDGRVMLTAQGEEVFRAWQERQTGVEFVEEGE